MIAFAFLTPWLLVGLAAAGIPFVLHLLSSARAKEVHFPTLRFLQISMEKTSRRRKFQHWLLLLLRSALMMLLAIAVAQPVTNALGDWLGGRNGAMVIVLDNSLSMQTAAADSTRLARAKTQALAMLSGADAPGRVAVIAAGGGYRDTMLTSDIDAARKAIESIEPAGTKANMSKAIADAVGMLGIEDAGRQQSVFILTDLQQAMVDDLAAARELADLGTTSLLIVDTSVGKVENVGIVNIDVVGRRVAGARLEVIATLTNSSPVDRKVMVGLRIGGKDVGEMRQVQLPKADNGSSSVKVSMYAPAGPRAGMLAGEVYLAGSDDLDADNVRPFCVELAGRVRVLLVRHKETRRDSRTMDPSTLLEIALDPWQGRTATAWSIKPRIISPAEFKPSDLAEVDALLVSNVPTFTPAQAEAITRFANGGGTVMVFLGSSVDPSDYNKLLSGVLPGRIGLAIGQTGPDARAIGLSQVAQSHPYFAGLYKDRQSYLTPMVQRYFRLERTDAGSTVLMRLVGGDPLVISRKIGHGRVTLCATAASGSWSNFLGSGANVMVSMVLRACFLSLPGSTAAESSPCGKAVDIAVANWTKSGGKVEVSLRQAGKEARTWQLAPGAGGRASFGDTLAAGVYSWRIAGSSGELGGLFAVSSDGGESDLSAYDPPKAAELLHGGGAKQVYVGDSVTDVIAKAASAAEPRNWWDVAIVMAVLLLVLEAAAGNLKRNQTTLTTGPQNRAA